MHVVGVNSLAAGHLTLVPELRDELAELEPRRHHGRRRRRHPARRLPTLLEAGAAAVFRPGHGDRRGRASTCWQQLSARPRPRVVPDARRALARRRRRSLDGVLAGDRPVLARAITLVESTRADHRERGPGAADRAAAARRRRAPGRDQRRARRRQVDVHRGAGHPAHRRRAPGGGARRRPVVDPHAAARSSATRPGWRGSPSTTTRSSGRRPAPARSAGSRAPPARRSC